MGRGTSLVFEKKQVEDRFCRFVFSFKTVLAYNYRSHESRRATEIFVTTHRQIFTFSFFTIKMDKIGKGIYIRKEKWGHQPSKIVNCWRSQRTRCQSQKALYFVMFLTQRARLVYDMASRCDMNFRALRGCVVTMGENYLKSTSLVADLPMHLCSFPLQVPFPRHTNWKNVRFGSSSSE